MTFSTSTIVALLAGTAAAFPGMGGMRREMGMQPRKAASASTTTAAAAAASSGFPAWHPPGPGDVRSPCPGLNALANHNICPHSGRGYTIPLLTDCLARGMNMGADFSLFVGTAGIGSNPNPLSMYFDLDMLDKHDFVIEHDASLSRADASTGDDHSFNSTIWNTVLGYYQGMTDATIPVAAKAKYQRVTTEAARDKQFSYGPVQFIFSYGETAIYLSTMGDPTTGVAPVSYIRSLFEEERLPYELGWRPTVQPTTLSSLGQMIIELNAANGEEVPEGLILGTHSLQAALIGLDAVTGDVSDPALYALAKLTGALGNFTMKA